ncbi:MAG: putative bifunctional diguanylate cyclase/phosphodiesterase [Geminicoccaceae bacterium]
MSDFGTSQCTVDHKILHAYLDGCIEDSVGKQELFTVLFVHLRGVRRINTMLGYEAGEEVVQIAIKRLRTALPDCDAVGRISSDELVVVSMDCNSPSCAIKGSRATISSLQKVIPIDGVECAINPVVGISVYPNDGVNSTELVRHAALAAERAGVAEDPFYAFFSAGLGENALKEFDLQQAIRKATSQRQFELHYQPKVNASTFELAGCEALIRWRDPAGGLRMPGEFLGVAERGGLMLPIGFFILQAACRQMREWIDRGYDHAAISINVNAKQFNMQDWVETVMEATEAAGIPPSRLTLEITEDFAMSKSGAMIDKMQELRAKGVRISIDDFGTGHSSLAYLSKLPIDEIKIDRCFVQSAFENETNAQICSSVIKLAHGLGAVVTAEGVETVEQADWMRALGCDLLQGFLFAEPKPVEEFEPWLQPGTNAASPLPEASRASNA